MTMGNFIWKRRYRYWIFSWAMSHICANEEYRSQVGATNRPENIVICYVSVVSLSTFSVLIDRFFTGLSLQFRADNSKVTAHERIQYMYVCMNGLRLICVSNKSLEE
jgi:hypothetical protein